MKKILFFIYILTIIITPCTAQQNNNLTDELSHFENIVFSWQYHYLENDKNIYFINLNPLFFSNIYFKMNTFEYIRRNYRRSNIQTGNKSSNENNVGNFIAEVGYFSMLFVPNSIMNQYQRDIYRNYNHEQSANEKLYR